jgi:excisionase family DNA binding protein
LLSVFSFGHLLPSSLPLLSPQELADYLGIPLQTIYVWAAQGAGPERIKIGRHTRYRLSAVDKWLATKIKQAQVAS